MTEMKKAQGDIKSFKRPLKKRPDYFKVNIDAAKAFDSVDRDKLISKMEEKGVDAALTLAIRGTLTNTFMEVNGRSVETVVGVPQGSILSP